MFYCGTAAFVCSKLSRCQMASPDNIHKHKMVLVLQRYDLPVVLSLHRLSFVAPRLKTPRLETLFCHFDQGLVVQTINYFLGNMNTKIVYVIHCLKFFYKYTCRTRQDSSYHLSCERCWLTYSIKYNNIDHLPLLKLHSAHLCHFAAQL